uniref:Uncharacterized protein n=1 Tax=Rhizophora mucronata TaxID=61149 RepID=A0A2P2PXY8_RHIMU
MIAITGLFFFASYSQSSTCSDYCRIINLSRKEVYEISHLTQKNRHSQRRKSLLNQHH